MCLPGTETAMLVKSDRCFRHTSGSIRVRLEMQKSPRELALFNLAIDSKLRACDLVQLRLQDICFGKAVRDRAAVTQKKTGRPVQFEITELTRSAIEAWKVVRGEGK